MLNENDVVLHNLEKIYYTFNADGNVLVFSDENTKDSDTEKFLVIKGLAKFIFAEIDGIATIKQIVSNVERSQQVNDKFREKFLTDTLEFLKNLLDMKILLKV